MATISIEDMRDKLLTLEQVRERLAATEPLLEHTFPTGSAVTFEVGEHWAEAHESDATSVYLTTPVGTRYQLTRQAVLEAGAYPGIPRKLQQKQAPSLLADQLNWWYRTGLGDREFKVLAQEREGDLPPLAMAMCRGTIQPFSNLGLLDAMLAGIQEKFGQETEILADYKFHHDLERTNVRLIIPESQRTITGTRTEGADIWSAGVQFSNSLIGVSHPGTSVSGYLFRYWCTNGCTDTLASTGRLARRTVSDPADAMEWARRSVDEVLGGLEATFGAVQALTQIPVEGEVSLVLADLFQEYGIPARERNRIIAQMAELGGEITLYDIQNAVTVAANESGLAPRTVDRLLALGGHVVHSGHHRCGSGGVPACRRLIPDGWAIPESTEAPSEGAVAS